MGISPDISDTPTVALNMIVPDRMLGDALTGTLGTVLPAVSAIPTPAIGERRTDPIVSDEVLARRLAEELNATGRKRRAPEPMFTPLTSWGPSAGKGAKAKKSISTKTKKKESAGKQHQKKPKSDSGSHNSNSDALLCDLKWQERLPSKELQPPEGFTAGDLVWVGLGSNRVGKKRTESGAAADTLVTENTLTPSSQNLLWWPGRVWKLRNCQHADLLWKRRGALPSVPKALVRCFGDGSFAWAFEYELAKFHVGEEGVDAALPNAENAIIALAADGADANVAHEETDTTAANNSSSITSIREKHDSCFSNLLSIAAKSGNRKKKSKHGLRVVASVARRALEEAEEAAMGGWACAWSASEGEEDDMVNNKSITERKKKKTEAIVDPRHASRSFIPREDGEKDGLTPDWVIDAGCKVFGLKLPSLEDPIIKGLLDPCSNNKRRPNIPAEKLYDKTDDGLKQENSWKGFHVILNPSYESAVQWRFINRAINECEWGFAKGVLLVCRNSTDTSYFQRLLPFPRVFLRRDAIMFKDYDNTPIGFGICVFCLVGSTAPKSEKMDIYKRFHENFAHAGEFNVPFDRDFMESCEFERLTDRLHISAAVKFRDSWVACDKCDRWREIPPTQNLAQIGLKEKWICADAYGHIGCKAPLTDREYKAFSVARKGHALVLKANKRGSDIIGYKGEDEGNERLALPGAADRNLPEDSPDSEDDSSSSSSEDGWNKVEKTEAEWRDEVTDEGDADAPTVAATATIDTITSPSTPQPDPKEVWLDEVSLRGGRKRFVMEDGNASSKKRKPKRKPKRNTKDTPDDINASDLTVFERERLEIVSRNKEKLRVMFQGNACGGDNANTNKKDTLEDLESAAAEASSKLNAAERILRAASIAEKKASSIADTLLNRVRKAASIAKIAEKEAELAEGELIDARAEEIAARAMVERLKQLAKEAEQKCDEFDV